MGETRINFKIYGANDQVAELEAVVDTGATFSKIPKSLAATLGLEAKYETEVELGDGRIIGRKLALSEIEIEKVRRPVLIAIGEEERPLIGYTTLELLGFKVNPITGKLEKAMPIEYGEEKRNVGDAFNLAPETETKVIDIANMVNEITGNHNGVKFVARRDRDKITPREPLLRRQERFWAMSPGQK
jgi:predicted aspartyl protease